jgi:glyoxylase-like metal-dependent hydrolase (beta-lactamase superfamily II)
MSEPGFPETGTARIHILHEGYVREVKEGNRVASTVVLIADGERVIIVDPGWWPTAPRCSPRWPRRAGPGDVTDVVFSHHHPDHTVNTALFPAADIHDHWATYTGDSVGQPGSRRFRPDRLGPAGGHARPHQRGHHHPGRHPRGVYACTHAWWGPDGPAVDPLGADQAALERSRERILARGHGDRAGPRPRLPAGPGHPALSEPGRPAVRSGRLTLE